MNFCVVETVDRSIFECPRNWFESNTVWYPKGNKYNAWKGRIDKPPNCPGAVWQSEKARLIKEYVDYKSAVDAAKSLEMLNTSEEETFFSSRRADLALRCTASQINVQDMINRNLGSENGGRSTQLSNIEANIESDRGVDFRNPNSSFLNQSAVLTNKEVSQNRIEPQTDDVSNETVVADQIFAVNIETLDSIMNVMTESFGKLEETQKVIFKELQKLNEKMDFLSHGRPTVNRKNQDDLHGEALKLVPIKTHQDLEALNQLLYDDEIFKLFVESMSKFGGKSGGKNGQKVALSVIDNFFDREFILECSWTGARKGKSNEVIKKVNFSGHKKVILSFSETVRNADERFSNDEGEIFIRAQLRNSKNRFEQTKKKQDNVNPLKQKSTVTLSGSTAVPSGSADKPFESTDKPLGSPHELVESATTPPFLMDVNDKE